MSGHHGNKNAMKKIEIITNEHDCHIVISHSKTIGGYIQVKRNGKVVRLHRWLYEQVNGEIPKGMVVRHKCDNPSCINIEHLELGTQKENVNDMHERGRASTRHGCCKEGYHKTK